MNTSHPSSPQDLGLPRILLPALLLALGLVAAGYAISHGLERFRMADRSITVKGLAERSVESDSP